MKRPAGIQYGRSRRGSGQVWLLLGALLFSMVVPCSFVQAVEPDEVMADPRLEFRARALSTELRCLVCQNQSIDDSNAPLARDLRVIVRERLAAGDSDSDVRRFVVTRYGAFVLLRPPFAWNTLFLWLAPLALLLITGLSIARANRTRAPRPQPLTAAEEARLARLTREIESKAER